MPMLIYRLLLPLALTTSLCIFTYFILTTYKYPNHLKSNNNIGLPGLPTVKSMNVGLPRQHYNQTTDPSYWDCVDGLMSPRGLYGDTDDVEQILETMRTSAVTSIKRFVINTSLKLTVILSGGQRCIFKPFSREFGTEKPRHEIATFHIDRLLGMRKAPYVTGRVLDVWKEVIPVADKGLINFLNIYPNGTVCFQANCPNCLRGACYTDGHIPGALIYYVRREADVYRSTYIINPRGKWRRIQDALSTHNETSCKSIVAHPPYTNPTIYMDLHDTCILDYVTWHYDRRLHHYLTTGSEKQHFLTVHIDLTFDRHLDKIGLSPLYTCCRIRQTTYNRLRSNFGETFQEKFAQMTQNDPLYPILTPQEIKGMLERVVHILEVCDECEKIVGHKLFVQQ